MHDYGSDSNERKMVTFFLGAVSVVIAWLLYSGLAALNITIPWYIDAPSILGIFGFTFLAFDKWLWRIPGLHKFQIVRIPDLNGSWKGDLLSSYSSNEQRTRVEATLCIKQSWTAIAVLLTTSGSRSCSESGTIVTKNPAGALLVYEYFNEPTAHAKETMHPHRGTARLTLEGIGGAMILNGDYYTGRGRQNFGELHFELATPPEGGRTALGKS